MGMITAHSGCDGTKNNSLDFIRYALDTQAECLEVDVRKNSSGELVLSHDESDENCVKLRDALALLRERPGKMMNCDLKHEGLELPVYRLAARLKAADRLIYSGAVSTKLLGENENQLQEVEIYINIESICPGIYDETDEKALHPPKLKQLEKVLEEAKHCHASVINMEYSLATDEVLECLSRNGLGCSVWTVDEEPKIRSFLEKDIANVTTSRLKAALEIRKGLRG